MNQETAEKITEKMINVYQELLEVTDLIPDDNLELLQVLELMAISSNIFSRIFQKIMENKND